MANVKFGYDVRDPFDLELVLDRPFNELNKRGRKAKKKMLRRA